MYIITIVFTIECICGTIFLEYAQYKTDGKDTKRETWWHTIQVVISGIEFTLIGIGFAITSYKCIKLIKNHFEPFYKDNKKKLIFASIGLSLPYIMKG